MTISRTLLCGALALTLAGCTRGPVSDIDIGRRPRIISLAPSVTETLFALGAGGEVVGVSQFCDFPPAVRGLPRVGSLLSPNLEAILALRPTLVIGLLSSSNLREINALEAMGIAILMVDDGSIAAIEQSIADVGDRVGRPAAARRLAADLRETLQATATRIERAPERSVLMVVGHEPMVAVGPGTFLDELLGLARARNIADAAGQAWPRLGLEYIIASAPEVILDGQMGNDPSAPSRFWTAYASIPAVRAHRVYAYPDDPVLHPGPRIGQTLEVLARRIHPESYAAAPADGSVQ